MPKAIYSGGKKTGGLRSAASRNELAKVKMFVLGWISGGEFCLDPKCADILQQVSGFGNRLDSVKP
jgi:hypothetical protein